MNLSTIRMRQRWWRAASVAVGLAQVAALGWETRSLPRLEHYLPLPQDRLPALSLVVAARDEATTVGPALNSLLDLDYPVFEVVFVDDRSSDGTAQLARQIQRSHPRGDRLEVIENRELPEDWLGKVHALHLGALATKHPLILMTDADVVFSPLSLQRAVTAQQVLGASHLAVLPRVETRGFWEPVMIAYLSMFALLALRPASLHRSRYRFVGVGAFTLLTRQMLEQQLDWLEPLRLQVIDDGLLGLMVKARLGRQFVLLGQDDVSLRWFEGLGGLVRGLEKNAYAAVAYHFPLALLVGVLAAAPLWSLALVAWQAGTLWALIVYLVFVLGGLLSTRANRMPAWPALGLPVAGPVLAYVVVRSAIIAQYRNAIVWRGTSYNLARLRGATRDLIKREFALLRSAP